MSDPDPLVSVVILCWNSENKVDKTLNSVLSIDNIDLEVIIVDNNSSDRTTDICKQILTKSDCRYNIVKNKTNIGYSAGKNLGGNLATGKYILLLDDDVIVDGDVLTKLVHNYNKEPKSGLLTPKTYDRETNQYLGGCFTKFGTTTNYSKNKLETSCEMVEAPFVTGATLFTSKKFWDELGGFDEFAKFNLDDFDISIRSYSRGQKNYIISTTEAIHIGDMSENLARRYRSYYYSRQYIFCKNLPTLRLFKVSVLFFLSSLYFSMRDSVSEGDIWILINHIVSILSFIHKLPHILEKRKATDHISEFPIFQ
ncbi:glycosyltransferase [Haloarcula halophila]|uniref:glycosyltransferase n=1 Tax=Haloarcula TaxID=2237 RepID=UPI0023E39628|nr:glycosyltransferase [Halomicroarcula sp. DFY41]